MNLIDKAWKYNSAFLHGIFKNKQMHHIYGRIGIYKCCLLFIIPLTIAEHNDWKWLKWLRDCNREEKLNFDKKYSKNKGCPVGDYLACEDCYIYKNTPAKVEQK